MGAKNNATFEISFKNCNVWVAAEVGILMQQTKEEVDLQCTDLQVKKAEMF